MDPDLPIFHTLDPDPDQHPQIFQTLDPEPDPHEIDADLKPCPSLWIFSIFHVTLEFLTMLQ